MWKFFEDGLSVHFDIDLQSEVKQALVNVTVLDYELVEAHLPGYISVKLDLTAVVGRELSQLSFLASLIDNLSNSTFLWSHLSNKRCIN